MRSAWKNARNLFFWDITRSLRQGGNPYPIHATRTKRANKDQFFKDSYG